jgi:hypothetical protein
MFVQLNLGYESNFQDIKYSHMRICCEYSTRIIFYSAKN